ncbi:MAG TPA: L,D-transpeptidase [Candidatus Angelobacter sp.]|jgi:lipoprotein-anchoring transpeptidase ErfK/SrfK|nr:L,D-transpeptidase [Candidatus Angelobacter sp.]
MRRIVALQNKNPKATWALVALMSIIWGGSLAAAQQQKSSAPTEQTATTQNTSAASESKALARFIVISIPDRQLALVDNGQVVKTFPVAVGKESTPSPYGDFTVINRTENPTYYHKGKVIQPGKSNPLGSRWMGLSQKGYGIHGTNVPSSIGKAASHGCFRMAKKDVEELFKLVRVGDVVIVRSEHDELVSQVFDAEKNDKNDTGASTETVVASADEGN